MKIRIGLATLVLGLAAAGSETAAATAAQKTAPPPSASAAAPLPASVVVDNYALVERAPVRNGFAPFTIEATGLLPAPRKRESFTPTEDERFHSLRRTVERFLRRKEMPKGWFQSNNASIPFGSELGRLRSPDGVAYAVEGELVVRGTGAVPLGLKLTAPADGVPLRFSCGLIIADQVVLMKEGLLDGASRAVGWMVSLRPNGPDAAIPVRAVFAVRAEGSDAEANRKSLAAISALMTASSDGRPATAERSADAAEWLKPLPTFLRPGQVPGTAP
ncbi:hypothetical protein [Magnetospirillum sp. SS-4]|uniref:hypothetical protein n=1 Tax=Magnetospirillum sp. SS-4 TaxID=2681465 RepID=UPI001571F6F2|nr:hypothetical protein [Magnetospirillum sp. SS-4]